MMTYDEYLEGTTAWNDGIYEAAFEILSYEPFIVDEDGCTNIDGIRYYADIDEVSIDSYLFDDPAENVRLEEAVREALAA